MDERWGLTKEKVYFSTFFLGFVLIVTLLVLALFSLYYFKGIFEHKGREKELKFAKVESDLKALRAQINPHFLFNCLNSIQHFIHTREPAFASAYVVKFSKLIRYVLESASQSWVCLKDELEASRLYLELEQVRKHKAFTFTFILAPELVPAAILVPPMILQPFLENAVWHGVKEFGQIILQIHVLDSNHLSCEIMSKGIGDSAKPSYDLIHHVKKSSMGIHLMDERFRIINELRGKASGFTVENLENNVTRVQITLPFEREDG